MMMRKAVVFTSYNRSDYLQETLRSWRDVANKNGYDFFFKLEPSSMQKKMEKKMISFLSEQRLHGDVINNPERKGVLLNPWEGLNTMFEQGYDFVVLAEDDIEVSDDILHFFDELSERHLRDEEVLAICASNLWSIEADNADHTTYFKRSYFAPLVWGTWKDRWNKYEEIKTILFFQLSQKHTNYTITSNYYVKNKKPIDILNELKENPDKSYILSF
jgi:hypothetical protein